jgi:phage shock protein C
MSAFCSNCGSALPPGARFCSLCGSAQPGFPSGFQSGFPPAGFPPPYAPRLVRPIFGRQFAGVCVGLARTYGWDVGLVRILAVVSGIFLFPFPEIFYIACWIGIPEEQIQDVPPPPQP